MSIHRKDILNVPTVFSYLISIYITYVKSTAYLLFDNNVNVKCVKKNVTLLLHKWLIKRQQHSFCDKRVETVSFPFHGLCNIAVDFAIYEVQWLKDFVQKLLPYYENFTKV